MIPEYVRYLAAAIMGVLLGSGGLLLVLKLLVDNWVDSEKSFKTLVLDALEEIRTEIAKLQRERIEDSSAFKHLAEEVTELRSAQRENLSVLRTDLMERLARIVETQGREHVRLGRHADTIRDLWILSGRDPLNLEL